MTRWIIEKSVGFTDVGLYSMGENIYMLPSDTNLKITSGTVGYNNKILVSDGKFSLGENDEVNAGCTKPEEETTKKIYKNRLQFTKW